MPAAAPAGRRARGRRGRRVARYARVPKESLPFDLGVFSATVRAAASAYDLRRPERTCSYCGESFAPIDMHDKTTCHGCAEIHLGIVH